MNERRIPSTAIRGASPDRVALHLRAAHAVKRTASRSRCQTARRRTCPARTLSIRSNRNSFRTAAFSAPAALAAPRVLILHLVATPEGMAERRQARIPCSRAALVRARRAPCDRCARLSALRRGGFGLRKPPRPVSGIAAGTVARASPRGLREPLAAASNLPVRTSPGRHARSVIRIVSGDAPHRAGCSNITSDPICSQHISSHRSK